MDTRKRLLFIGCRNPQKLIVMSADDGKILAALSIGAGVDATKIDGDLAFASCADGSLAVARETSAGKIRNRTNRKDAAGSPNHGSRSEDSHDLSTNIGIRSGCGRNATSFKPGHVHDCCGCESKQSLVTVQGSRSLAFHQRMQKIRLLPGGVPLAALKPSSSKKILTGLFPEFRLFRLYRQTRFADLPGFA